MKEPKTILQDEEARMADLARWDVEALAGQHPEAREIDLVNAYLTVFAERVAPPTEPPGATNATP